LNRFNHFIQIFGIAKRFAQLDEVFNNDICEFINELPIKQLSPNLQKIMFVILERIIFYNVERIIFYDVQVLGTVSEECDLEPLGVVIDEFLQIYKLDDGNHSELDILYYSFTVVNRKLRELSVNEKFVENRREFYCSLTLCDTIKRVKKAMTFPTLEIGTRLVLCQICENLRRYIKIA